MQCCKCQSIFAIISISLIIMKLSCASVLGLSVITIMCYNNLTRSIKSKIIVKQYKYHIHYTLLSFENVKGL